MSGTESLTLIHIAVICGVLFLPQCQAISCSTSEVQKCLIPLKGYEYQLDNAIVPTMDEASLTEHCRRYSLFEDCMKPIKPYCTTLDKLIFSGIEDAYQFLCVDGKSEFLQYRTCFTDKNLHREGDTCNVTYTTSLNGLQTSYSLSYRKDRICQYTKQYLDCVERVVESFCGANAAKWQRKLDTYSLNPLLSQIGCSLGTYAEQHWVAITIGVLLTVSVIIIIVSVVMVLLNRSKKRQQTAPRTAQSDPPPDYHGPYMVYNPSAGVTNAAGGQAPPIPDKSVPVDPPPYQSTPSIAPEYTTLQNDSGDNAVAAGYFGVSPNVNVQERPGDFATDNKAFVP